MSVISNVTKDELINREQRFNKTYHRISPCPLCGGKIRMIKGEVTDSYQTWQTKYTPQCANPSCFLHTNRALYFRQTLLSAMLTGWLEDDGAVLRQAIVKWNRVAENVRNRQMKNHA